jgi:hypothetical protein
MSDEIDFAMNFEDGQQSEADKKLLAMFYTDVIKNEAKSIDEGRPIFDNVTLIRIITPGSRDTFVGDATPEYQARFPQQWARFKAGRDQTEGSGTPLNMIPWLQPNQVAEFKAVGCHTVEQLVGMPDSISHKFMGHLQIKQRAQEFLDLAKEKAPGLRLQAELEKRDAQIEELKATVAAMMAAKSESKRAAKQPAEEAPSFLK